jgi:hypothetical protein
MENITVSAGAKIYIQDPQEAEITAEHEITIPDTPENPKKNIAVQAKILKKRAGKRIQKQKSGKYLHHKTQSSKPGIRTIILFLRCPAIGILVFHSTGRNTPLKRLWQLKMHLPAFSSL